MHILIAAHDFYPDPGSGGTGRYVAETARRLVENGHRVSVITRRRGDIPTYEPIHGIDVYRYDLRIAQRSAPEIAAALPGAATTVSNHVKTAATRAGPPAVLSYQGPVTSTLVDRFVDGDVVRVSTFHSPWPTEYRLKCRGEGGTDGLRRKLNVAVRRVVESRLLSSANSVVTLSESMLDEARRVYDISVPTRVIPGGVDVKRFEPSGPDLDRIDGNPAFLTVRRLSERMGHALLLEAFSCVLERHPGARLYIAGDGPLRDSLEADAEDRGVAHATTFLGYVPDEELPSTYRSADVFVLPTTDLEGFGLATLEALASGLPVVATPIGGTVEIIEGLHAHSEFPEQMLVEGAHPDALARGMIAWADLSPVERATAGDRCRRYVRDTFPWSRTAAELEHLYLILTET